MNNLYTITSHSLKTLVSHLARDIKHSSADPLSPETIVVQSSGMSRWINIEVARLNGICAGINYKFPNTLIDDIFGRIVPESAGISPFEPDILSWRIMSALPGLLEHQEFGPVKKYCNNSVDDRGLMQFSSKVADCFDQYTVYRPEMILEWDRGGGSGWQPLLWRAVSEGCQARHRTAHLNIFRERINKGLHAGNEFPKKIRLFGVSYLPLYHLEILSLLSKYSEVIIYLLNPCGEYWGDLISRKKLASISLNRSQGLEAEEYYETGNPLLSSLGTMGQEFFNLLLDSGATCETIEDPDVTEPSVTLLNLIQSDILHMHDRSTVNTPHDKIALDDSSLQVHSCHGPLREMQVLHDNLLQMFTDIPDLEPRHVLVMTPDIESYAPYISAVFGDRNDDRPEIPFSIADRSQQSENIAVLTFNRLLKLSGSRFGIHQILELLESDSIMTRFNFSTEEVETVREWLSITRVRWGVDAAHRESLGFTGYEENSWQNAINRLLLGYALPPENNRLFHDILPYGGIEGRKALIIGKLVHFFEQIKQSASLLAKARTLYDWADTLTIIVKNMMGISDHTSNSLKPVFEAIQKLRDNQDQSGFTTEISLDTLQMTLSSYLDIPGASFGFMGGKVTFCAMLPMRSIPFRIICMVGMNDSIFPRNSTQPGFSLMKGKRLCGDRSLREEDRYLFLEALMSAEERLFISYTGQNCRDNSEIPPSVVVSELLDYVSTGFFADRSSNGGMDKILIRHHLQSFSPSYFKDDSSSSLFSYSRSDCSALGARRASGYVEIPFCSHPLPSPDHDAYKVDIRSLIRFYSNPAAQFLAFRLGVKPDKLESIVEDRESFSFNSLDNYLLKQDAVQYIIDGGDGKGLYPCTKAASKLPPLSSGFFAFEAAITEAEIFANKVQPHLSEILEPLTVSLQLGKYHISGQLDKIRREHLLRFRSANLKAKDRLSIWIEHLILNLISPTGYPRTSLLICKDVSLSLPPLDNSAEIISNLLDIYIRGLCKPLPFFTESSFKMMLKGLSEAEKCWKGGGYGGASAENIDPAYQLCFGRQNPLNEEFSSLAIQIYGPLLDVAKEEFF